MNNTDGANRYKSLLPDPTPPKGRYSSLAKHDDIRSNSVAMLQNNTLTGGDSTTGQYTNPLIMKKANNFMKSSMPDVQNRTIYDNMNKMPMILAGKHYNKLGKISNVRNIILNKEPPLYVKFERFGKNFD